MSRKERRLIEKESAKLIRYVGWIEEQFICALFQDNGMTYMELYEAYLGYWVQICTWFNKNVARRVYADTFYFKEVYKPIESL